MGRKSKIESHPQSEEIIRLLASGEKYSSILHKFHDLTRFDLDYYRENKLPEILSKSSELKLLAEQIESADVHKGDTYLQLVVGLQKKALDALDLQNPTEDARSWAMISREARGYLELLGKALDRIKDSPQINLTQVNIYQSPAWLDVGHVLIEILADHPDLKAQVAGAFLKLQEDHV